MQYRNLRVAELIKEALANILIEHIRDPDLQSLITVSEVEVSADLKRARIYYKVHGGEEEWKRAEAGFKRAKGYIKRLIGEYVFLKYVPDVEFLPDRREEYQKKIEEILDGLGYRGGEEDL